MQAPFITTSHVLKKKNNQLLLFENNGPIKSHLLNAGRPDNGNLDLPKSAMSPQSQTDTCLLPQPFSLPQHCQSTTLTSLH